MSDDEVKKEDESSKDMEPITEEKVSVEERKKGSDGKFLNGFLTGVLGCALISLILIFVVRGNLQAKGVENEAGTEVTSTDAAVSMNDIEKKLESLETVINNYYYYDDTIDMNAIADEIFATYIAGLDDKYSRYYTEDEMNKMMDGVTGTYCGIGAVVSQYETGEIVVILPYEGSPAAEAKLQPGDVILSIDGTVLTGMTLEDAVAIVKGEEGTSASFKIKRDEEEFDVDITRRQIDVPTVSSELKEDNIGYIHISSFDFSTVDQYTKAVDDLIEQGAKGIIFDLRNNGGGALTSVVDMLDYILPEGLLVYMEDKYGNRSDYYSKEGCIDENIPMAVIINGNSASASEVFAGALQDYGRAEIIGTQSYGKGVVQNIIPLTDGSGLKLTIASYFTPLGRNLDGTGIEPDQVVELPTDDASYDEYGYLLDECDTQLNTAVEYIKGQIE